MNTYTCDHCGATTYFDHVQCLGCGHVLSFVPDECRVAAMRPLDGQTWRVADTRSIGMARRYRLCRHYRDNALCNWAICDDDPHDLCTSCRMTTVVPGLYRQDYRARLYTMESAKRRLILNLRQMALPLLPGETGHPLRFVFMASHVGAPPTLSGHHDGPITVNLDEPPLLPPAGKPQAAGEPSRTVLRRLRHESGNHYWHEAFEDSPRERERFRQLFGDEREDLEEAMRRHHSGPPKDWQSQWITPDASAHPLEDWAETWAHYMMLNELQSSPGQDGACPSNVAPSVGLKLRFVHDTVRRLAVLG